MSVSNVVKSVQDIMRQDAGVDGDAQRISQLVWMIFLKVFDAKEEEWELEYNDYESVVPEELRWSNWAADDEGITGDDLLDFINNRLFKELKEMELGEDSDPKAFLVKAIFEDSYNYMKSGALIRQVINKLNEIDFTAGEDRHLFNDIYENILKDLQSAGNSGEFYTPRPVTQFIIDILNPQLGEKVADFACGTGGFLTCAIEHLKKQQKSVDDIKVLGETIIGVEKKPLPHLLATTNLILHDIDVPNIAHDNSLMKNVRDLRPNEYVNVIAMNPPFGGVEEDTVLTNFPKQFQTKETADLFMTLMMYRLSEKGRAGVVLPDGFLFGEGVKTKIKEKLLSEFNLHTIVRMPNGVFAPYTGINTNLLFFEKGEPTKDVWFFEHPLPQGYKNYAKTKPIRLEEFDLEKNWWNDIAEMGIVYDNESLTEVGLEKGRLIKADSVLMVCIGGSIGKNYFIDRDCSCNQQINSITGMCGIDSKFIHYIVSTKDFYEQIISKATGSATPIINKSKWEQLLIQLPPLNEQKRIVEKVDYSMKFCDKLEEELGRKVKYASLSAKSVLNGVSNCSSYEELEEALRFIINNFKDLTLADEAIKELKNAILSLAVKGKLVSQDENDEPASVLLERIREEKDRLVKEKVIKKEKALPEIGEDEVPYELPKGWEWIRLGEICKLITKGSSPKWQGVNYIDNEDGVLFITSENVGRFNLILKNKKYLESKFNEIEPRSILQKGDILTNIVGASIGRTAIYDLDEIANINQAVCIIRVIEDSIFKPYLLSFLNSDICIGYMYDKQVDCARANLSMTNIARFLIPIPPLEEQKKIVKKVDLLINICDDLEDKIEVNKKYSKTLMESILSISFKA